MWNHGGKRMARAGVVAGTVGLLGLWSGPAATAAQAGAVPVQRLTVGTNPTGVVIAGMGGRTAVVTNNGDGTLSFVDTKTAEQSQPLSLGADSNPAAIIADRRGRYVFVASNGPIVVVDVGKRNVIRSLAGTDGAFALALAPDGSRLYSDAGGNGPIVVSDPHTGGLVRQVPVPGFFPGALAVSPDGRRLYVAAESSGLPATFALLVLDTTSWQVTRTTPLPLSALDLAFTPNGRSLYLTSSINFSDPNSPPITGNTVLDLDPMTLATRRTITVGQVPIAIGFAPNGRTAYVVNYYGNSVSIISTSAGKTIATVPVNLAPSDVAVTRNGQAAFVTETGLGAQPGNTVAVLGKVHFPS
jgi:YVTN family beta-propeller protein